ncbi:helix-turn-helix domain-containing protein [Actinomadura algeriensis]|uniref:Transcriptional regulator with XRE-family HTH domain n=1 Tax=Actinomadura algeriensis TaxID=1679523 RepID=A0ABR9JV37_9ACTN|nr:helix-turn-helix transcriptional regulator [Actinomadura algeriensis]MBE1533970.1 transcriptional regulator with XRE-family HTH domain [Actinomadura algeriensis]
MAARKPSPNLIKFGAVVEELREKAQLTRTSLAKAVAVTPSYVGQVEKGRTRCRRDFAIRLDDGLHADGEVMKAWETLVRKVGYPAYYEDFPGAEETATLLRTLSLVLVDGLFQTEAYARALLQDEEAVENRLRRQEMVTQPPAPLSCLVLDEGVLYRQVGSRETMLEQTEFLMEISERDTALVQVAPFGFYKGVRSSFSIATQADQSSLLFAEQTAGGDTTSDPVRLSKAVQVFTRLQAQSLSPEDTRHLIRKVANERWS